MDCESPFIQGKALIQNGLQNYDDVNNDCHLFIVESSVW